MLRYTYITSLAFNTKAKDIFNFAFSQGVTQKEGLHFYLYDYISAESTQSVLPDIAIQVVISQLEVKLQVIDNIGHARVRAILGVHLAIENLVSSNSRHHIGGSTVNCHIVA
jgi:hypothetical protein